MVISVPSIILSIVNTKDKAYVLDKLKTVMAELDLNAVDKRIIDTVKENADAGTLVTVEFLRDTFSYVFESDAAVQFGRYLSMEAIDGAIANLKIKQIKKKLASELLNISGQSETLTLAEIKDRLTALESLDVLGEDDDDIPDNGFSESEDAYSELQDAKGEFTLLIPEVEAHAGMAARGTITTILGFVGSYKSTYALNVALANALKGFNVLYLALENTEKRIFSNAVVNYISISTNKRHEMIDNIKLRDGKLTQDQIDRYNEKYNELANRVKSNLIIWDTAKFKYNTFLDMTRTLRKADKKFKKDTGKGIDCIFIDQVSLLRQTHGSGRKATYDGAVINDWMVYFNEQSLNFLGEGRQIAIFPLSQVGREKYAEASKKKNKGRYGADCASDSNEIERISTSMITLYVDQDTRNTLLMSVPKARRGVVTETPIQTEVYGEYSHVGRLNLTGQNVSADDFSKPTFDISQLI